MKDNINITIEAEHIAKFNTFDEWVNKASSRLGGFAKDQKIICIDKNGNTLTGGTDFMSA